MPYTPILKYIKQLRLLRKSLSMLLITALLSSGCAISPQPLTLQEIDSRVEEDIDSIIQAELEFDQGEPITIYDAMARALKNNLDHRLKLMEAALAVEQLDISKYDLLPKITASAGYNIRNNDEGSYSESLIDGSQSLVASTSRERSNRTADISIMWNVLDFGVSYARAKQQADRVLILEERRRKVIQNIIQDVRYAYWRAVSAEQLINEMVTLLKKTKFALDRSRQIAGERLQSPKETLEYQKALLENIRLLWSIIQKLTPAKVELASLMNLPPGAKYSLVAPDWNLPDVPSFNVSMEEMERTALSLRPELREEDYRARISAADVRKALLQMLPSLSVELEGSYDSNQFLYNSNWWDAGALISQNIIKLFSGPKAIKAAKAQQEIDNFRRKAVSMAVMVQVHLAYQRFALVKKEYFVARQLDAVNSELNAQTFAERTAGGATDLEMIRTETNSLVARMRHYQTYAELQNAVGRMYHSLGIDLMPSEIDSTGIESLSIALEEMFVDWEQRLGTQISASEQIEEKIPGLDLGMHPDMDPLLYQEDSFDAPVVHPTELPVISRKVEPRPPVTADHQAPEPLPASPPAVSMPPVKAQGQYRHSQTASAPDAANNENDTPGAETPVNVGLRSDPPLQSQRVFRTRLFGYNPEDGLVEVKLQSKSLNEQHAWLDKNDVHPVLDEDAPVQIQLRTPLDISGQ